MTITLKFSIDIVILMVVLFSNSIVASIASRSHSDINIAQVVVGRAGYAVTIGGALEGLLIQIEGSPSKSRSHLSQFTISLWLKIPGKETQIKEKILLDKSSRTGDGNEYRFSIIDDLKRNLRQLKISLGQNGVIDTNSRISLSSQEWAFSWIMDLGSISSYWEHLAVTWDSEVVKVYINGTIVDRSEWKGKAAFITDYGNPLVIGGESTVKNNAMKIRNTNILKGVDGIIDCLTFWNEAIEELELHSIYQAVPSISDKRIFFNFLFDEGQGQQAYSTPNLFSELAFSAEFLDKRNSRLQLKDYWVVSTAPFGSILSMFEGYPSSIQLFVSTLSSNIELGLSFQIVKYPSHGRLYTIKNTILPSSRISGIDDVSEVTGTFFALDEELYEYSYVSTLQSLLVYVPTAGYRGSDFFTYSAVDLSGIQSPEASIIVEVKKILQIPQLYLQEPSTALEQFRISDSSRRWDDIAPLTVSVGTIIDPIRDTKGMGTIIDPIRDSKGMGTIIDPIRDSKSVNKYNEITLSLATTHDLYFSERNGQGTGVKDVRNTFNAYSDVIASDAISSIELFLSDKFKNTGNLKFQLEINVSNNNVVPLSVSTKIPISIAFSSVPQIISIYPSIFSTTSTSSLKYNTTVDVLGKFFSDDVSICSVNNVTTAVIKLSATRLQCILPILKEGKYKISIITLGGLTSNTMDLFIFPSLIPYNISPSLGPQKGGTLITVKTISTKNESSMNIIRISRLFCIFGFQSVRAVQLDKETVQCVVPPFQGYAHINAGIVGRNAGINGSTVNFFLSYNEGDSLGFLNEEILDRPQGLGVTFTYLTNYRVDRLEPSHVTKTVNSESGYITLYGMGFIGRDWMENVPQCRFGGVESSSLLRISDEEIQCKLPTLYRRKKTDFNSLMHNKNLTTKNSGSSSSYFLSVEITANGVDYTDIGLFLTVLPPIILSHISPIFISSHL